MMKNIIVTPFNVPWDWSTDYTNQTAFELARKGNTVICYLWSDAVFLKEAVLQRKIPKLIRKYSKNIYLINPWYLIPFRRFRIVMQLNSLVNVIFLLCVTEVIAFVRKCRKKIFWIFDPNTISLYRLFGKRYSLLYDCVDYFPGAVTPDKKQSTIKNERQLLLKADIVVANSRVLQKYLLKYRKEVDLVPQGFRLDSFGKIKSVKIIKRGTRPLIGFVGAVNYRLDFNLLYNLIQDNPKWDFAIWGPILEKDLFSVSQKNKLYKLSKLDNVIMGKSPKSEIPGVINEFDIGMIPYNPNLDFNKFCYPMKIFEYFYLGKPVISTDLFELRYFPDTIRIGRNPKEWKRLIKEILLKPWPERLKKKQRKLAIENSWKQKVTAITELVEN